MRTRELIDGAGLGRSHIGGLECAQVQLYRIARPPLVPRDDCDGDDLGGEDTPSDGSHDREPVGTDPDGVDGSDVLCDGVANRVVA